MNIAAIPRVGRPLAVFVLVVSTIGCDRVTKHMAATELAGGPPRSFMADTVRLEYAENSGGFLSLGADLPPAMRTALFTIGSGMILIAMAATAVRRGVRGWPLFALSLYMAGAGSNWIDRLVRGSVVDFLNVGFGPLRTGIFNVADVAITAGIAMLVLVYLRSGEEIPVPTPRSDGAL